MSGTTNGFSNGAPFYLDTSQQDLLLAALASNNPNSDDLFSTGLHNRQSSSSQFQYPIDNVNPTNFFASPQQSTPVNAFSNIAMEESPFLDYMEGDTSFDYDNVEGDLMIGALPTPSDSPDKNGDDSNEKRKSPDDDDDEDDEGGGKRREGDDKQAKKPGRKPLTSEPTTKRKAQNRAAQRAFRERKEKHLKDLETKVQELEKASDAANHENGLLRAQVQRLQMELREYRKRLSLNSTGINRTTPLASGFSSLLNNNNSNGSNFSFEFPRFGGLPGTQLLDNGPLSKPKVASTSTGGVLARQNSAGNSLSPTSQLNGSFTNSPDPFTTTQTPTATSRNNSVINSTGTKKSGNRTSSESTSTAPSRVFQFNSGSSTHSSESPSSSTSPNGQDSSCGTSPEPSHQSPGRPKDSITEGYVCHGNSEGEVLFCEKLNMACGNPRNPVPRAMSQSDDKPSATVNISTTKSPLPLANGIDYFANQNGGQFDPTLFGEYRDTQNAIVGEGDFTGGFFNDAFLNGGYGSPFHFGDTPAVQKPNPLEEIERLQDAGDDEVVPGEDINSMLNCHKIWDKLSSRADFKDGTIDIDNLCSELRAKARCSESGVVVDHKDVEAALKRLPQDKLVA